MEQFDIFDFTAKPFKIQNKIRLIELFGGIGSQAMALRDLGADFERYRLVEFDDFCIKAYNAIHGTEFVKTDIRDIHGEDLGIVDTDKYTYIMFYSFPCFVGDTLVTTSDGLKQIKDVCIGDYVLTHKNKYEKVIASNKTGEEETYRVVGMGIDEIRCTGNHRFYARKMKRHYPTYEDGKRGNVRTFGDPDWVECKDLTKDHYLGVAINQNGVIPEWDGIDFEWEDGRKPRHKNQLSSLMGSKDFWWLIGRYLGDGWKRTQGGIIICSAKEETREILPYIERCGFNYSVVTERTVDKIHIPLKEVGKFVSQFGYGASGKKLPGFVFDMPRELLQSLVEGYASADGYVQNDVCKLASISKELIYGMAQCVAKAYMTPYRIYKYKRNETCIIEGRKCNQRDSYTLAFKTEKKPQDKAFYEDGYVWFPIKNIEKTGDVEDVYDIETENDHSFMANGVIAHNCTDLSVAGEMKGMAKGSGTRSGLLWEVERLLNECDELPQVLIMENVPQVHGEANRDSFKDWIRFLEQKGYENFIEDLNAKDYGVAQSRDRCFMVSVPKGYSYKFPKPIELPYVMKDYLEDDAEERFFLTSDKAKELIEKLIDNGTIERERERETAIGIGGDQDHATISEGIAPTLCTFRGARGHTVEMDESNM